MADINEYIELIPSANKDKPKFTSMLTNVLGAFVDVNNLILSIPEEFDLDSAVGVQLDVVGQWVGVSRYINQVLLVQFFGFDDNPAALTFGEEGDPSIGGRFYNEGEDYDGSSILADPEYRLLIRAQIIKNKSHGTLDDIKESLAFLFPNTTSAIYDNGDMTFDVAIGRPLTLTERAIIKNLDIIPRPAGVRINSISYFGPNYLGFEGQDNITGFAEEGETDHGFLAEEI